MPISARSFWNRNRSRETRGGRRDGRVRGEEASEAGRSASKTRHSFPTPSSQPTRSETRRRSSPAAGRPLAASIYASANANRPRLSLCTPSVLPSSVRPSSQLPSSIHGMAWRVWDFGVCTFRISHLCRCCYGGQTAFLLTNVIHIHRLSTLNVSSCMRSPRYRSLIDRSTHTRHISHL